MSNQIDVIKEIVATTEKLEGTKNIEHTVILLANHEDSKHCRSIISSPDGESVVNVLLNTLITVLKNIDEEELSLAAISAIAKETTKSKAMSLDEDGLSVLADLLKELAQEVAINDSEKEPKPTIH